MNELIKKLDKIPNIILIFVILIGLAMLNQPNDTKKEVKIPGFGTGWTGTVTLGAGTILLSRFASVIPVWGWIVGGVVLLGPMLIGKWGDLFRPQPSIPSWIWVGGFLILALTIFRKR